MIVLIPWRRALFVGLVEAMGFEPMSRLDCNTVILYARILFRPDLGAEQVKTTFGVPYEHKQRLEPCSFTLIEYQTHLSIRV